MSEAALDPEVVDGEAADVHAEDRLGVGARLVDVRGDLDPARLAALADPDLGLDDARIADLLGGGDRVVDGRGVLAHGGGHAVLGEELLCLDTRVGPSGERAERGRQLIRRCRDRARPPCHNHAPVMPLPKLKEIKTVTTDCYGTLIDWEKGLSESFRKEADRDGITLDESAFLARFIEVQAEIMSGSYELYAEVLRRAVVKVAGEIGWELEPSRAQFVPDSVPRWQPFREANAAMDRLGGRYDVGIVSNIDDKLLGVSRRHLRTELDIVVTAQQVRSYKPDEAHFKECARRLGSKKGWVHIASGYDDGRRAGPQDEGARDLGEPARREARGSRRSRPRR